MSEWELKPIRINFSIVILQFVFGIAVILILATIAKPPDYDPSNDPFLIMSTLDLIYNNCMLIATKAAEMLVYVVIGSLTLIFGGAVFIIGEKTLGLILIILDIIQTHQKSTFTSEKEEQRVE